MSETQKRFIAGGIMALVVVLAGLLEHWGVPAVRYLGILIVLGMIGEMISCMITVPNNRLAENRGWLVCGGFLVWLFVVLGAISAVGVWPQIVLWMLMIIVGADVGAWFFGNMIGGDKLWERVSAAKTWSGQIAGIICGAAMSLLYGVLVRGAFDSRLLWVGISVALLSQYGDLTASWVKRKMGLKDFGNLLPGHGGLLDRFDGWIYVLPLLWLFMM